MRKNLADEAGREMSADPLDWAAAMADAERDAGVARASAALAVPGLAECEDCGDRIPDARRAALPSVRRCVACQSIREAR